MNFKTYFPGKDDEGRRLDKVVRKFLNQETLSQIYKSIRNGLIKVNGKKVKPEYKIQENDELKIADFLCTVTEKLNDSSEITEYNDENIETTAFSKENIIFKNEHILAINKPYDISVQGKNSLAEQIAANWKKKRNAGKTEASLSFMPGPLHRLDRKTSGVLVFSQSLKGAKWFSEAIANHKIKKTYIAILEGKINSEATWETKIENESALENFRQSGRNKFFYTVKNFEKNSPEGKLAISKVSPLATGSYGGKSVTLCKIRILTGRKHQIRSQAAYFGFPLLGDTAYGGTKINESQDFFLHALELEIPEDNPLGLPPVIKSFISTKFEKMLNKILINYKSLSIIKDV